MSSSAAEHEHHGDPAIVETFKAQGASDQSIAQLKECLPNYHAYHSTFDPINWSSHSTSIGLTGILGTGTLLSVYAFYYAMTKGGFWK